MNGPRTVIVFPEQAITASTTSGNQFSHGTYCDIHVVSDVTGTDTDLTVEAYDEASDTWYTIISEVTITGDGSTTLRMGPTLVDTVHVLTPSDDSATTISIEGVYPGVAPRTWRLKIAGTFTTNTISATATYNS